MHPVKGSICADGLCANAQGSGTQHFFGVHSSVERLASVPRTPLYSPLLIRSGLPSLTFIQIISTPWFVAVGLAM